MVGKPNIPTGTDATRGAASPTPGLTALDQQREASMADEGGASGMHVESEDTEERDPLDARVLLIGAGVLALAGFVLLRSRS